MKILVCLIAVLAITAPVLATTVTIVGDAETVPGELTLKYYVSPDTDALRGIALTLSCSDDATTNAAGTTPGGEWNVCIDHAYQVIFDGGTYALDEAGSTPLAKTDGPGVPVGNVSDFVICLGMVDETGNGLGVEQGSSTELQDLCTIVIAGSCTVTATGDTLRGEAVGSPVEIIFDMNNDGTPGDNTIDVGEVPCFEEIGTVEQIAAWYTYDVPPLNWCDACFACGDVNSSSDVTTADWIQIWDDLGDGDTSGRSDVNMSGDLTTADWIALWDFLKAKQGCTPCE